MHSWFGSFISSVDSLFPLFLIRMAYLSMLNSIPTSRLNILIGLSVSSLFFVLFFVLFFYSYFTIHIFFNILEVINLFQWFWKCVAPIRFLNTWLSDIIPITNVSRVSLPNFFGFYFCLGLTSCYQFYPLVFHGIRDKFMIFSDILYIFRHCIIQLCWTISLSFLSSIYAMAEFSTTFWFLCLFIIFLSVALRGPRCIFTSRPF